MFRKKLKDFEVEDLEKALLKALLSRDKGAAEIAGRMNVDEERIVASITVDRARIDNEE